MWGGGGPPVGANPWAQHQQQQPQNTNGQWSLNPNHYANIPHNQVDWAALAQQWMMLKGAGTGPSVVGNHHQPLSHGQGGGGGGILHGVGITIPQGQFMSNNQGRQYVGEVGPFHHLGRSGEAEGAHGGPERVIPTGDIMEEAPMELEPLDQDSARNQPSEGTPSPWTSGNQNSWLVPDSNNPWNSTFGSTGAMPGAGRIESVPQQGQLRPMSKPKNNTQGNFNNISSNSNNKPRSMEYGYFTSSGNPAASTATTNNKNSGVSGGYWAGADIDNSSASASIYAANTSAIIDATSAGYNYSSAGYSSDDNSGPDFDAAKRKALPAWIREGLEKVERQKKKEEEAKRLALQREELRKQKIEEAAKAATADDPSLSSQQSKWNLNQPGLESDEDEPEDVSELVTVASIMKKVPKEEQDEVIMYAIRRVSTSLLVRLTNEVIMDAATSSYNRAKSRNKGLGLGGYGSESDEGSEHSDKEDMDDETTERATEDDVDSEEELKAEIQKKKRNWELLRLEMDREEDGHNSKSSMNVKVRSEKSPKNGDSHKALNSGRSSQRSQSPTPNPSDDKDHPSKGPSDNNGHSEIGHKDAPERKRRSKSLSSSPKRSSLKSSRRHRSRSRSRSRDRRKSHRKPKSRSRSRDRRRDRSRSGSRSRRSRHYRKSRSRSTSLSDEKGSKKKQAKRDKRSSSRSRSSSPSRRKSRKSRSRSRERRRKRSGSKERDKKRSKSRTSSKSDGSSNVDADTNSKDEKLKKRKHRESISSGKNEKSKSRHHRRRSTSRERSRRSRSNSSDHHHKKKERKDSRKSEKSKRHRSRSRSKS